MVRHGLRAFLTTYDEIDVVGEAERGADGVALAAQLVPDVVLMDLVMPEMDGIETARQLKAVSPTTQVIVLTSYSEDERIFPAIKAGALSYLLKDWGRMNWCARSSPPGAAKQRCIPQLLHG
jgi:NarL family two-component system response regulator LiaR